jgi:hypothetical protein
MIKILKSQKLPHVYRVQPRDTFVLYVNGEVVHTAEVTQFRSVSHWALIEIAGGLAYVIGDDSLPAELEKLTGGA